MNRLFKVCIFAITLAVYMTGCGSKHTLPSVESTSPSTNATDIATNKTITANFNLAMDATTINTTTFTLMQGATPISGTVTYSTGVATFTPSSNLAHNTIYTATIAAGVKNVNGDAMSGNYSWSFTTNSGVGAKLSLPANAAGAFSVSAAFDNTNYLVGMEVANGTDADTQTAQLISPSGTSGASVSTGRTGGAPAIAFDGTNSNYLMVWSDYASSPNNTIYGERIDTSGAWTDPFPISTTSGVMDVGAQSIICNSLECAVVWRDKNTGSGYASTLSSIAGCQIPEKSITNTSVSANDISITSDGNTYFVAWDTGTEIRGSIVTKCGMININTDFLIAAKSKACTDSSPVGMAFDGTNYLVVWNDNSDCSAVPAVDVLAQFVDTKGNPVNPTSGTSPFKINSTNTWRAARPSIAFDGANYMVAWTDSRNDTTKDGVCDTKEGTCDDIYGQYVSNSGTSVGSEFVINNDAGNLTAFITGFNAGSYLVMVNSGVTRDSQDRITGGNVYGVFVAP